MTTVYPSSGGVMDIKSNDSDTYFKQQKEIFLLLLMFLFFNTPLKAYYIHCNLFCIEQLSDLSRDTHSAPAL